MTVRMRHTRSQTGQRRSHHALKKVSFAICLNCKAKHIPHTICHSCGTYRGRTYSTVSEQKVKKLAKKAKEAAK